PLPCVPLCAPSSERSQPTLLRQLRDPLRQHVVDEPSRWLDDPFAGLQALEENGRPRQPVRQRGWRKRLESASGTKAGDVADAYELLWLPLTVRSPQCCPRLGGRSRHVFIGNIYANDFELLVGTFGIFISHSRGISQLLYE